MKKNLFMMSAICITGLLTVSGAHSATDIIPNMGGTYRAPLSVEPTTLDPAYYTDIYSMTVAANIFDGLVKFDDNLKVIPSIAKVWKISRDHKIYTFVLDKDVKFHHGREVTAEDFIASFSRILTPNSNSPVKSLFMKIKGAPAYHEGGRDSVEGLRALNNHTLQIELDEPFAPFLSILAMVNAKVLPVELLTDDFAQNPVGTGPFRFSAWEKSESITLNANSDYFDGAPHLDTLSFKIYTEGGWEKIFEEFSQGKLDHAEIPSAAFQNILAEIENEGNYNAVVKPGLNLVYIGLNSRVPPLHDVRVRQALNYAVDTQHIVTEITQRGSVPAKGILPPGIAGFDPDYQGYSYDPDRARRLLAEAGYPEGENFPVLQVWTAAKHDSVRRELEYYKRLFADVGVAVEIHVADSWKAFVKAINDGHAGMYYAAWYADYPDPDNFLYPLTHSKSVTNRMKFSDSVVDALLDKARGEVDYLVRAQIYRNIEQMVMNQAPVISQHINSNTYLFQPWVENVSVSRLGITYLPFHQVWFDKPKLTKQESGLPALAKRK